HHQYIIYSADGNFNIQFSAFGTSDAVGGYIDDVKLTTVVPEPETYAAVFGLGLAAFAFLRRRRVTA
ncbi:MAG: PEP-CTERM sorting domain-containing protein, partial [Verrucomicrobiae bacterium]|nr:PEP-CTERM sorting domain-containing protein [Verrucomicrobiae bacterium]